MIKTDKFLSTLLPNFERTRILETIERAKSEYETAIIPVYATAAEALKASKFSSPLMTDFDARAKRNLTGYKGNVVQSIHDCIKNAPELLMLATRLVNEHYDTYVTRDGMDFAKLNTIQFVSVLEFAAMYSRRFLLVHYNLMMAQASPSYAEDVNEKLMERELKFLENGFTGYIAILNILATPAKDIERRFKDIPDALISVETVNEQSRMIGQKKVDPLAMGFIPYKWNPIFHMRLAYEEWRANRARLADEERASLELHILQLKALSQDGKLDPAVAKQIAYYENRVAKLRKRIRDLEE